MDTQDFRNRLDEVVRKNFGPSASVSDLSRLTAGASSESWRFDAALAGKDNPVPMVLRRPPAGFGTSDGDDFARRLAPGRAHEAAILGVLNKAGLAVPEVLFELTPEDGLGSGYAMNFLAGNPLPHRILKDPAYEVARGKLPEQITRFRHDLNKVPAELFPFLPVDTPESQIKLFEDMLDWLELPHAGLELGLSWLRDHLPQATEPRLVHGDYRLSNYMITEAGLNAVIDWELTHLGDPLEDLGWLCVRSWRFSNPQLAAAGLTDRRTLLAHWNRISGDDVTLPQLLFQEMLGNVKWAMLCLLQGHRYISSSDKSIELPVIGRRVEEPVYDLIRLLEGRDGVAAGEMS
jgi:aminoglycoside phosphotransferase (APT) family kinase protein